MRWKFVTWITLIATYFSDILIKNRPQYFTLESCKNMPKNSLGYSLYHRLTSQNLKFKPNLVRHDLKHVLLNYKMNMPDELRICAFMLGNRSQNIMSTSYLIICTLFVPEIIGTLKKDFKRGRLSDCLKNVEFHKHLQLPLSTCRKQFNIHPLIN